MRSRFAALLVSLFIVNCAPKPSEKIDLSKTRASFMLADGSPISTDEFDEYNPILITRPDGYLVLLFGSDRDCGVCTPGYHNMFVSVSVAPYENDLSLPAFSTPVVVLPDGASPADSITRLEFMAESAGPNTITAYNASGTLYTFQLTPVGHANGQGSSHTPSGNTARASDTLLGFGPLPGTMISRDGSNTVRYSSITAQHNGRATDPAYATADNVTRINPLYTGFLGATFAADSGSLVLGTLYEEFGLHPHFEIALDDAGLYLTSVQVFDADIFGDDLLLFSAHDGLSDDIYAVDSHTVGELWDLVGIYGGFDDAIEMRNIWTVVPTTLPALRGGMAAAAYGNKAYLIGGTADGSTAVNTIYEFDMDTETFTNCGGTCGTWPTNLHGGTAIESGGLVYVVGGSTTTGAAGTINVIRSFNPANQAVTLLATMPVSRQITSLAVANGKIYMMGGGSATTDCVGGTSWGCSTNYSFDILGNSWSTALTAVTHPFSAGATAVFGDSIFAFGGFVNGSSAETNAVGEYSVTGNTWPDCGGSCPTLTTGRYNLQAVTYGPYAYIIGGANQGGTSFANIEEFNMITKTFTACDGGCATMPLARNVGSAVSYNGQIYYFGGNNAGPYVNTIFKYVP